VWSRDRAALFPYDNLFSTIVSACSWRCGSLGAGHCLRARSRPRFETNSLISSMFSTSPVTSARAQACLSAA
jgi:hypothetical protein